MGFILELALVAKGIAALGMMLTGLGGDVSLSTPLISLSSGYILVSCGVEHGLNKDLRNVIDSGTPITLRFTCRLVDQTEDNTAVEVIALRTVTCNMADSTYQIRFLDPDSSAQMMVTIFDETSPFFRLDAVRFYPLDTMDDTVYKIIVEASLDPIRVEAMGRKDFNLMAFWNFKRLKTSSGRFTK